MQHMAIIIKEINVKIETNRILVECLILTQQDPCTYLDKTPKIIIKNKKKPMKEP